MVDGSMNKYAILLGVFPLVVQTAEVLEPIVVEETADAKMTIQEESFFRTYTKDTITKEDIQEESAIDIKSALSAIPNVQVKETGAFSKELSIRGLSGDRVVSIVDGMKLVNQGITHSGGGELGLVDLSTVEKIEVVKGSPSVIYDPGATGGVIEVATLKDVSKMEDSWGGKYTFGYDDGYLMKKHTLFLEGKYDGLYAALTRSITKSEGRNVKDKKKAQSVLDRTNAREEREGTEFELTNLGYESDAYRFASSYQFNDKAMLYFKKSKYEAEDISFSHGSSTSRVFHYDEYKQEGMSSGLKLQDTLGLDSLNLAYHTQSVTKIIQPNVLSKNITEVTSKTIKLDAKKDIDSYELKFGTEQTHDDAKTYTTSQQTYQATYLNGIYYHDDFIFSAGARYNHYHVKQNIEQGRNLNTIYDLVGVSGVLTKPIKKDGVSYATGVTYLLNDTNNISLNYSRTYRFPTLYERFAFDTFIGGGADMIAEEGDNYELSYKYLDDSLLATITLFYTDFDSYNDVYRYVKIKNLEFLRDCNSDPECNPFDGGDNENEIFTTFLKYASFDNVTNKGFELTINKKFEPQQIEAEFTASLNDFTNAKVDLPNATKRLEIAFDQDPLEFAAFIKKEFSYAYKPWVKLKLRHVTNMPNVEQEDGFESFTLADLYFGAHYEGVTLNAGIRNLADEVYHEPYLGLDGIKRTLFMNLSIPF